MIKHPGEILRENYLIPNSLQPFAVAQILDIDFDVLYKFIEEKRPVTIELSRKLACYYETEEFWYNAQIEYDKHLLKEAKKSIVHLFRNNVRTDKECEQLNKLLEKIDNIIGE